MGTVRCKYFQPSPSTSVIISKPERVDTWFSKLLQARSGDDVEVEKDHGGVNLDGFLTADDDTPFSFADTDEREGG